MPYENAPLVSSGSKRWTRWVPLERDILSGFRLPGEWSINLHEGKPAVLFRHPEHWQTGRHWRYPRYKFYGLLDRPHLKLRKIVRVMISSGQDQRHTTSQPFSVRAITHSVPRRPINRVIEPMSGFEFSIYKWWVWCILKVDIWWKSRVVG